MSESVSLLLGAGFSAPMGYPVGSDLNDTLLNCTGDDFAFDTSGVMIFSTDGSKPDIGYKTSYDFQFDFCRDLMQYFNKVRGYFDYEEFYDFFNYDAKDDLDVKVLYDSNNHGTERDLDQMLYGIKNIYSQLVAHYLVDGEGKSWYDDEGHKCGPWWPPYTGILNCLQRLSEQNIVNIHTLNHDLLFESFNHSDWLEGELCDGFEELGSPYYGELDIGRRSYKCRLQHYTGLYNKKFRLFKLHGSKDYMVYYKPNGTIHRPHKYLKTRYGIGVGEIFREIEGDGGGLSYDKCNVNYHADFLTGTTSKIERYAEPLLFNILFDRFKQNLKEANKLVIIGYGANDSEVNKILLEHFDFANKPCFIIDPFAGDSVEKLKNQLGAKLISKELESIEISDLE